MNGKVNKRIDGLLHLLLKYETNSFFNRQTKELMWKYNRKEAREKERHQLGTHIAYKDFKASILITYSLVWYNNKQLQATTLVYSHHLNLCMGIYTSNTAHTHACMYTHAYTHMHAHTHLQTHMHTHIYTYVLPLMPTAMQVLP